MIHWIAAPDDPRLEPYRYVGDPRWLRQQDLFVAEGRLVVERLLDLGRHDVASILVNRAAHDALVGLLAQVESRVFVCDDATLAGVTGFNFHRGCLALVRRPPPLSPADLMNGPKLLALEGVSNPDNVGGLFRTAAAFGVDGVLLSSASGDPFYRKAVRTSMGAVLRLPFARLEDWRPVLAAFRSRGFTVVALTPQPDATPLSELVAALPGGARVVVVVGAEGPGLTDATLGCADARVRIPIDSAIDSLNVVVAAGIALESIRSMQARRA
ncbi:MAG: TrmH family RNA methyltransferase [Vicinamibacterales bacterium]